MLWFNSKRKLKNVTLTSQFQIQYFGWWFIICLVLICLLSVCVLFLYEEHWRGILLQDPYRRLDYLVNRYRFVSFLVVTSLVLVIITMALGIMTTHRIAGPFIALRKGFEEVKNGDLSFRLKFRKEDELSELERSFNEMMDTIESKYRGT